MTKIEAGEKLIYDNTYPVRFEGRCVEDEKLAVVSEDGCHFLARWDMLRRPTYPKGAIIRLLTRSSTSNGSRP